MRTRKIIGGTLIASPFVGLAAFCFAIGGWHCFGFVFGGTALGCAAIFGGLYLIEGGE